MDSDRMMQIVDAYIEVFQQEILLLGDEMRRGAEEAQERMETLRLPDDSFFELWNPQATYHTSKVLMLLHTHELFALLDDLAPDDAAKAKKMIVKRFHRIIDSFFSDE